MNKSLSTYKVWMITGSQHLYGDETLKNVESHSREIAGELNESEHIPVEFLFKALVTTPDEIYEVLEKANHDETCIGVVVWMHTFSPAKMWINGLKRFKKPLAHLHTQYNREIPWSEIDMDFMNENQSAHGGREFGFMASRLRKQRKVIVGHWQQEDVQNKLGKWTRVCAGWHELQRTKVARIGDNMREVAVTEGDKVEAQMRFGFSINGYGLGEVVKHIYAVSEQQIKEQQEIYEQEYTFNQVSINNQSVVEAARIEIGLRAFLEEGGFSAYTNTFENLSGMKQLPGIASQRLMAQGYGFGAEGDWKTAALLRAAKVMDQGLEGGTSFMEDYTYDFHPNGARVLGSHMLEICPTIANVKPKCEVHPLSIGGKEDPVRLVFDVDAGPAINVSLVDMGNRFRLLINEVDTIQLENDLPKLPVARVLWEPKPNLDIAAHSWILAGGAHHTVFSKALDTSYFEDLAEMAEIETLVIDNDTKVRDFKQAMQWNEVYYQVFQNRM